ncbi:hypothetical protein RPMA_01440 [Tardiphaga alba]|uniref:Uncharacterized protein n=1 Tax=Tardiphaga alba TaxID=340268 RepID=A0ABX8A5K5_9BRAD|nr:hypothetical protein [Tardiphaga alba]QUS37675.1 hypothetical protein RPMA_01440 [Tardiphaga alba]
MRNDSVVPPLMAPDSNPPQVSKSDRLPLEQWSSEAVDNLPPKNDMRIAAAIISEDPKFLEPILIRGSLEDTITRLIDTANDQTAIEPAITEEPVAASTKPRAKRQARRTPPVRVAEAPPTPELPEPNFFEKLFGTRFN